MSADPSPPALPATIATCPTTVRIEEISSGPEGLSIRATGPVVVRIASMNGLREQGMAGFAQLTVELPGATLGSVPAFAEWPAGPFASMRVKLFRNDTDCGVRLRLQPMAASEMQIISRADGVTIAPRTSAAQQRAAEARQLERDGLPPSGAARVTATGALAHVEGNDTGRVWQLQLGLAQRIPNAGTLRAFVADIHPRAGLGAPYAAIALAGVDLDLVVADVAAGDLSVALGDTGLTGGALANTLVIRGGGASLLLRGGFGLQAFAGLAARSSFVRLPDFSGVTSELSDDQVYGTQLSWSTPGQTVSAAAAYVRSVPANGPQHDNFVQSLELQPWARAGLRVLLEESRSEVAGSRRTGYAFTFEPRASTDWVTVNGSLRSTSTYFRPPLASSFFANLRESYFLNATFSPTPRLAVNVSWGLSRTFNFFDPQDVGTLVSSRSAGVGYQVIPKLHLSTDFIETEQRSDDGALLPADSLTRSVGLAAASESHGLSGQLRLSYDWTANRFDPAQNLRSLRARFDGRYNPGRSWELFGRSSYALSSRPAGQPTRDNYSVAFGGRWTFWSGGDARGEVGHYAAPAGIFGVGSGASYATAAYRTPILLEHFQLGVEGSYQLLEPEGRGLHHGWTALATLTSSAGWGRDPRPAAPYETRAMPLVQTRRTDLTSSVARVHVFEDRNGDGKQDSDEPGLSGVTVTVDDATAVTGPAGAADLRVTEHQTRAEVRPEGVAVDYYLADPVQKVELPGMGRTDIRFGLRSGGRVTGQVTRHQPQTERPRPDQPRPEADADAPPVGDPPSLPVAGLRAVLRGMGIEREAMTDNDGVFVFGVLPVGSYEVELDRASLPPDVAIAGPASIAFSLAVTERREIHFVIRPATIRERLGMEPEHQFHDPRTTTQQTEGTQ